MHQVSASIWLPQPQKSKKASKFAPKKDERLSEIQAFFLLSLLSWHEVTLRIPAELQWD